MMKKIFFGFIITFSFLLFSCDLLRGSPFVVESWSPGEGFHNDPAGIKISILFSGESDRVKTEQAFSLTENHKNLKGVFSWEGNKLLFTPSSPLEINRDYSITLGTGAQDTKGISLENKFEVSFTTRPGDGKPKIIRTEPEHSGSIQGSRGDFRVSFSGRVTANSCMDFISFEPHTYGSWRIEDEGKTARFTPREPWQAGSLYRVKVGSGFEGASGLALGSDYTSVFYAGEDREKPTLLKALAVIPAGSISGETSGAKSNSAEIIQAGEYRAEELTLEKAGAASGARYAQWENFTRLELVFSEPVDGSVLKNLLSLEPSAPLVMESPPQAAEVFRFRFSEHPAWGSSFLFRLSPGVKDSAGNESTEEYAVRITCAGPLSKPPALAGIRLPLAPGNRAGLPDKSENQKPASFIPGDLFSGLSIEAGEGRYPYMEKTPAWIELYFETAPETEIDLFSVMELFRVEATNQALAFSPRSITADNFTWASPKKGWEKYTRVEISGVLTNKIQTGVVTFRIPPGLRDKRGNRSAEDFRVSLQK